MLKCTRCKKNKEEEEFYKRSDRDGYEPWCKPCLKKKKKDHYERTKKQPHFRWKFMKSAGRTRGLKATLTEEEYVTLIQLPCYYCEKSVANEVGTGLDRLDNDRGYETGNVVTCCADCNLGRNAIFTPEEWKVMINAVKDFREARGHGGQTALKAVPIK